MTPWSIKKENGFEKEVFIHFNLCDLFGNVVVYGGRDYAYVGDDYSIVLNHLYCKTIGLSITPTYTNVLEVGACKSSYWLA